VPDWRPIKPADSNRGFPPGTHLLRSGAANQRAAWAGLECSSWSSFILKDFAALNDQYPASGVAPEWAGVCAVSSSTGADGLRGSSASSGRVVAWRPNVQSHRWPKETWQGPRRCLIHADWVGSASAVFASSMAIKRMGVQLPPPFVLLAPRKLGLLWSETF